MGSRIKAAPAWDSLTRLAVLGICFAAGTLGGFLFSGWSGDNPELLDYLTHYFQMAGQGNGVEPALLSSIWDLMRWPLVAFLLGASPLGVVGIPALLTARGFLLSYSAAIFARLFGFPGVAVSLAVFSVTALVAVPVLFVVSVFIIANTIKLTTFDRRDEIAIMKMVGATNGFIRWPFVYEGFLLGLFSAVIGFFLQWGLYEAVARSVATNDTINLISVVPFETMWEYVAVIFAGAGMLIGVGGSLSAIRKFLQV